MPFALRQVLGRNHNLRSQTLQGPKSERSVKSTELELENSLRTPTILCLHFEDERGVGLERGRDHDGKLNAFGIEDGCSASIEEMVTELSTRR